MTATEAPADHLASSSGTLAGHETLDQLLLVSSVVGPTAALCNTNLNVSAPSLQKHLPSDKLAEVRRVLFGLNKGKPVRQLLLPKQLCDAVRVVPLGCVHSHAALLQAPACRLESTTLTCKAMPLAPRASSFASRGL